MIGNGTVVSHSELIKIRDTIASLRAVVELPYAEALRALEKR